MKKALLVFIVPAILLISTLAVRTAKMETYYMNSWGEVSCPAVSQLNKLFKNPPMEAPNASDYMPVKCVNSNLYHILSWLTLISFLFSCLGFAIVALFVNYKKFISSKSTAIRICYDICGGLIVIFITTLIFVTITFAKIILAAN